MSKKSGKKKDFLTCFGSYYGPHYQPAVREGSSYGNPPSEVEKMLTDSDREVIKTGFSIFNVPYPSQNKHNAGCGNDFIVAQNRVFHGPFEIMEYHTLSSTGAFKVKVSEFNGIKLTAFIKAKDLLEMMKDGQVYNSVVTCDLTFERFGSSHFLVKAEDESN